MKKKILLVDDDKDLVESLSERLEAEGYEVIQAFDGVQAWEKIRAESLDLIILDVMMPNKHGYQVAEEIKTGEYADIPVIMLTAVGDHITKTNYARSQGVECKAEDYIPKPVNIEELLKSIKSLM